MVGQTQGQNSTLFWRAWICPTIVVSIYKLPNLSRINNIFQAIETYRNSLPIYTTLKGTSRAFPIFVTLNRTSWSFLISIFLKGTGWAFPICITLKRTSWSFLISISLKETGWAFPICITLKRTSWAFLIYIKLKGTSWTFPFSITLKQRDHAKHFCQTKWDNKITLAEIICYLQHNNPVLLLCLLNDPRHGRPCACVWRAFRSYL